eukprot:TRINITY_DN49864_c0_g1_i1.p1 TRINITY_DN49864_c0_g1~~TRINITY_DN49864_c0_g1_i1.p1  ORF type:complete len:569 (-),score=91.30 TRINITY_DN49864_c0_g1_i1:44-1750(-)
MMNVHRELERVLSPHIAEIRKDLQSRWPSLEPELTLIHWLCERNHLTPPCGSLLDMKQSKSDRDEDGKHSQLPPLSARAGPTDGRGKNSEHQGAGGALTRRTEIVARKMKTPLPVVNTSRLRSNSPRFGWDAPYQLGLKTLTCTDKMKNDDAHKVACSLDRLRDARDRLETGAVANMRRNAYGKLVSNVPLLSATVLTAEDKDRIVAKLRPCCLGPGEVACHEGDPGDELFIIEHGSCDVCRKDGDSSQKLLCVFERGDFFGEMSVIFGQVRAATVMAKTKVTLLSLSREDLLEVVGEQKMDQLGGVSVSCFFGAIPVLSSLTSSYRVRLAERLRSDVYPAGAKIATQNAVENGDRRRLCIVTEGLCRQEAKVRDAGGWRECATELHVGDYFGMLAMYYGCTSSTTVIAKTPVVTLSLSRDELIQVCDGNTAVLGGINVSMQRHLLSQVEQLNCLGSRELEDVLSHVVSVSFKRWEQIFAIGSQIDDIYILETGKVCESHSDPMQLGDEEVQRVTDGVVESTAPGSVFGMECIGGPTAARSTLGAVTDCSLLHIPGLILRRAFHSETA